MHILIDNYDSFTYILHHYLQQVGLDCRVCKNDEITVDELAALKPHGIIISPGPETPVQAGISMEVIKRFHQHTPILGVCLGHQALGMFFGAQLAHAPYPMHGKVSEVKHNGHSLFSGVPSPFPVMRYHSLVIEQLQGSGLTATAHTEDGIVMAMAHQTYPCIGVQFHPESVGTPHGLQLLQNWKNMYF